MSAAPVLIGFPGIYSFNGASGTGATAQISFQEEVYDETLAGEAANATLLGLQALNVSNYPGVVIAITFSSGIASSSGVDEGTVTDTQVTIGGYSCQVKAAVSPVTRTGGGFYYVYSVVAVLPVTSGISFTNSNVVVSMPNMIVSADSVTVGTGNCRVGLYNGVDPTANTNWGGGSASGSNSPLLSVSLTAAANNLAVAAWCAINYSDATTYTITNPTTDFSENGNDYANGFGIVPASGTYSATATCSLVGSGDTGVAAVGVVGLVIGIAISSTPPSLPNIVGLTIAQAIVTLEAAGYSLGTSTPTISPTSASNVVLTQSPAAGSATAIGSAINVTYALSVQCFPYDPEQEYTETLSWATEIIESYAGYEQRIKLRQNPRQVLNFEVFLTNSIDNMTMRLMLFKYIAAQVWVVPSWWEQTTLTAAASPGNTVLYLDTTDADYRVGCFMFIRNPSRVWESALITAITSTTLTIATPLVNSYPVSRLTQIMPARQAYAKSQSSAKTYTLGQTKFSIQFTTIDNTNLAYLNTSLWPLYLSLPVLGDANYIEGTVDEGTDQNGVVVIDNTTGTVYQEVSTDRARPRSVKTWWTNYRQDIWSLRQLGHYLGGSQGLFWLPTNRNDLQLAATINSTDTTITVDYVGYTSYALDATSTPMIPFANIRITLTNGTVYYRKITAASFSSVETDSGAILEDDSGDELTLDDSAVEILTIDSDLGATVTVSQVMRIDFMQQMRISDDKMTFTHDHAGRAKVVINCVGVRQ